MKFQKTSGLIQSLFNKTISEEDLSRLNDWYESLNYGIQESYSSKEEKKAAWEAILEKIESGKVRSLPTKKINFKAWFSAAAVVLILAFGGYAIHSTLKTLGEIPAQPGGSFSNPLGSVSRFLLPDSSQVWLSTGSTLSYAENFPENRKVSLEGEAFFEVKPNPEAPFEIQTDTMLMRVLGTSFNLKAYPGEKTDLSVYTGKVQFGQAGKYGETFILTQNQSISWSREEGFSVIQDFDATQDPDWKSGVFYFENSSLEEVVHTLRRWYPVDFEIKGKAATCRYSGKFHRSSLEQVLEIMSYTLNLNYQLYEEKVELKPKNCE